ncbi:hypothetical protein [Prevotella denticola]
MGKNGQAGDAFCQASFSLSKDSSQREKKTTVSRIKKRSIIGSSEIWSDKAGLLHRAHRETEKTEEKTITEVPMAQKSDRDVTYWLLYISGTNAIHHSHQQMLW